MNKKGFVEMKPNIFWTEIFDMIGMVVECFFIGSNDSSFQASVKSMAVGLICASCCSVRSASYECKDLSDNKSSRQIIFEIEL